MTIPRVNSLGWAFGELLTSGQMNNLDTYNTQSIDGLAGGDYALQSIGGRGSGAIHLDGTLISDTVPAVLTATAPTDGATFGIAGIGSSAASAPAIPGSGGSFTGGEQNDPTAAVQTVANNAHGIQALGGGTVLTDPAPAILQYDLLGPAGAGALLIGGDGGGAGLHAQGGARASTGNVAEPGGFGAFATGGECTGGSGGVGLAAIGAAASSALATGGNGVEAQGGLHASDDALHGNGVVGYAVRSSPTQWDGDFSSRPSNFGVVGLPLEDSGVAGAGSGVIGIAKANGAVPAVPGAFAGYGVVGASNVDGGAGLHGYGGPTASGVIGRSQATILPAISGVGEGSGLYAAGNNPALPVAHFAREAYAPGRPHLHLAPLTAANMPNTFQPGDMGIAGNYKNSDRSSGFAFISKGDAGSRTSANAVARLVDEEFPWLLRSWGSITVSGGNPSVGFNAYNVASVSQNAGRIRVSYTWALDGSNIPVAVVNSTVVYHVVISTRTTTSFEFQVFNGSHLDVTTTDSYNIFFMVAGFRLGYTPADGLAIEV